MSDQPDLVTALLAVNETLGPIFDAADGVKANLERRGWSLTAAEQAALTWLTGAIVTAWKGTT